MLGWVSARLVARAGWLARWLGVWDAGERCGSEAVWGGLGCCEVGCGGVEWVLAGRACVGRVAWGDSEVGGWRWVRKGGPGWGEVGWGGMGWL